MPVRISTEEAVALTAALKASFEVVNEADGRSVITVDDLSVGRTPIPQGSEVFFPAIRHGANENVNKRVRHVFHAIIFFDHSAGSSIRVEGDTLYVTPRNCRLKGRAPLLR